MNKKNRIWFGSSSSSSLCRSRDNIDHENIIMLMMWTIMMIENWLIDWKNIWSVVETGWIIRTRIFFGFMRKKSGYFDLFMSITEWKIFFCVKTDCHFVWQEEDEKKNIWWMALPLSRIYFPSTKMTIMTIIIHING